MRRSLRVRNVLCRALIRHTQPDHPETCASWAFRTIANDRAAERSWRLRCGQYRGANQKAAEVRVALQTPYACVLHCRAWSMPPEARAEFGCARRSFPREPSLDYWYLQFFER